MRDTFEIEIEYGVALHQPGSRVTTWKENCLGRINEGILKATGLLYANRAEAETGSATGATAFFVSVPIEQVSKQEATANLPVEQVYVVTASHVANQGFTFLRCTDINGKTEYLELPKAVRNTYDQKAEGPSWIWNDEGNDIAVAVCPLEFPGRRFHAIPISAFATTASPWGDVETHIPVEIGDEVFMPGRSLALNSANPPLVVRFGRIASSELISVTNESVLGTQDSYLAELRSENGYSGAPVLLTKPALNPSPEQPSVVVRDKTWLLGVNWGHLPQYDDIRQEKDRKLKCKEWVTKTNSGIATVVPASKLFQVLHYDELRAQRQKAWEAHTRLLESGVQGVPDC